MLLCTCIYVHTSCKLLKVLSLKGVAIEFRIVYSCSVAMVTAGGVCTHVLHMSTPTGQLGEYKGHGRGQL